jgi:hypothetical protein
LIVGWLRCAWAESIATRFSLLVLFLVMAMRSSLAWVILLSRNRSSLLHRRCSVCLMCWRRAIFLCLRCSCGPGGMMVLSSSICCVGLGTSWWVGALGWERMAYALCNLGLGLGLSKFLALLLPVTIIHLSSFSPSSGNPARRQSSPDSLPSLAYPPNLAANLWRGLNATLSSSQIDLKR